MKSLAVLIMLLLSTLSGLAYAAPDGFRTVPEGYKEVFNKTTGNFDVVPIPSAKKPKEIKLAQVDATKVAEDKNQIAKNDTAKTMQAPNEQTGGPAVGGTVPPSVEAPKVVQPLPVVSAPMDMVFVMNKGLYLVEVEEVKGKAHDMILPKHIGQFSYSGFDGIVLKATVYKKRRWWWSKKILEVQEDFKKGTSWVWVFDYRGPWRTQDLRELPPRKS